MKKKVLIYISHWNKIGGVERFVINLAKRLEPHTELTVLFEKAEEETRFFQLSEHFTIERFYKNTIYHCDTFICATAWGQDPYSNIHAKKYIQVIHADLEVLIKGWGKFTYFKNPKVTHHVCVSKHVRNVFQAVTPYKCDKVIYNLLDDKIKPFRRLKNDKLKLITVSRISQEKGIERMIEFAKQIPVPFEWKVFGNGSSDYAKRLIKLFPPGMTFQGVTEKPLEEISKCDYLVQLSDTEGYCYAIIEALQVRTPVLCTPFPSAVEQINDGVNGYFINFEVDKIDWKSILERRLWLPKFEELSSEKDWLELIEK